MPSLNQAAPAPNQPQQTAAPRLWARHASAPACSDASDYAIAESGFTSTESAEASGGVRWPGSIG
eukprot:6675147-Prymnesium_polylepis.1